MGSYQHQDWETVYLNKKDASMEKARQQQIARQSAASVSSVTNKPSWKIEKQVDSDTGKPITYVSKADADAIRSMRIKAQLTQAQLAPLVRMKFKDIQDIESCKAVENKADISRVKQFLQKKCASV